MIIFFYQEDEEAENEENFDSRKDECLYRRCRPRELGDEKRIVETSLRRTIAKYNEIDRSATKFAIKSCGITSDIP